MSNFRGNTALKTNFTKISTQLMTQAIDEKDLIAGIRERDTQALELVYKRYYGSIAHFILQNNGTEQEAKDIYQEAIVLFYEKLQEPHFLLTCQIKTYIYSICRKMWLKVLRNKEKYTGKIEDFEEFIPFEQGEDNENSEKETQFKCMEDAMKQLGEPCATILTDFYIEEKSMAEITEKMGYTNADNTKTQKYKCLMRLKKIFFLAYK